MMGDGVIPTRWFGDFAPDDVHVGNARRGQYRPAIFEAVNEILWKGEPHKEISLDEFSVLKEVGAIV